MMDMTVILYSTLSTLFGFAVAFAYYMLRGGRRAEQTY